MSEPYVGEIRLVGFSFAPQGWLFCDGALLLISEFAALFSLIGTTYGGDGQQNFGLPDLRGRVPLHMGTVSGNTYTLGAKGGVESVTLTGSQIAAHSHPLLATSAAAATAAPQASPPSIPAQAATAIYAAGTPSAAMTATTVSVGGQPHDNLMPYLGINFIISLFGVYPSQS